MGACDGLSFVGAAGAVAALSDEPARLFGLKQRGRIETGFHADLVLFDPATIGDHSTFAAPHAYSTGVRDVFVNGEQVLRNGEHTGATPGQVVRGPGWTGHAE